MIAKPNRNGHAGAGASADEQREHKARTKRDADHAGADLDQTSSADDQGTSDSDQLASDTDQELADREQSASDRVQAAVDRQHEASGQPDDALREEREEATRERGATAAARSEITAKRLASARQRDEVADLRDRTAAARDQAAQARDLAAAARDEAAVAHEPRTSETGDLAEVMTTLKTLRLSSAARRQHSELERLAAASDRDEAAADRKRAATERRQAGLDELTGVFRRGMGEVALTHEIERSRRTGGSLVVAMIDVDDLKATNDNDGHAAGDALLRDVGAAIATTLRTYDVTVRWGGDEFVCALSNVTLEVAAERIAEIREALAAVQPGASISAGLAQLGDADNLESVILNADAALYSAKISRHA